MPRAWRVTRLVPLLLAALAAVLGPGFAQADAAAPATTATDTTATGTPAGTPEFDQQVLFKAANETGYSCFRIPAIVKTADGTLVAVAEGRKHDCGDAGPIDVVAKRSTDDGRTWGPLQVVNAGGDDTHGNPVPIVDRQTGRIVLITTYNAGRLDGKGCDTPCDRTPHMQYSDDDGATWSTPTDLSDQLKPADWNSWIATGPGHAVQLTKGRHAGRLVFGVNAETWDGTRVSAIHASLIYSDDHGTSWHIGATDSFAIADDGTFTQKPSEMSIAERQDGSLYISGREQDGTDLGHRDYAISKDGGETYTRHFTDVPDLYAPQVQGAVLQLGDRMIMSLPMDPDRRRRMMVRASWNKGRTWDAVDRGKLVTTDWSGYSDLVLLQDAKNAEVGLLYEGGPVDARDEIRYARFNEAWLGPRPGPYARTADTAPGDTPNAYVLGDPAVVPGGRFRNALSFDGVDDAVRLPFRDSLPLGESDFTAVLWFRYTAASGDQPLLWMGGVGSSEPQVWLRAEPASNRVDGYMTVRDGAANPRSVQVLSAGARNDGQWHQAALRRGGGQFTLTVDGVTSTVADIPGSVSRNSPFGVHLGMRLDSLQWYHGDLDDARIYRRALSDDELAALRTGAEPSPTGLVSHLPLDDITAGTHDEE